MNFYDQFGTELVCVTPPGCILAPSSAISPASRGKAPGRKNASGLWAGYDWRSHQTSKEDYERWTADGANIGLRSTRFPGLDVDCTDPELAETISSLASSLLGAAPIRIGNPPKRLLLYSTQEPFGRLRLWIKSPNGQEHLVEMLGEGQQYVVAGIHPKTLGPYSITWPTGLTSINLGQVADFFSHLQQELSGRGFQISREGDGERLSRPARSGLQAPSIEILREALGFIPNDDEVDRDEYIRIGCAIKAAAGEETEEGFQIFSEWADRWTAGSNDPETVRSDWRRIRPPFSVGWGLLRDLAGGHGFSDAGMDFDVISVGDRTSPDDANPRGPTFSDQWLTDRVVEATRDRLRYVTDSGRYLAWDGQRWLPRANHLAADMVNRELVQIAEGVLRQSGSAAERKRAEGIAKDICSAYRASAVRQLLETRPGVAIGIEALDADPWLLNTPGGVVDLKTGKVRPAERDLLMTKITSCSADFGPPRLWYKFLEQTTKDDIGLINYLKMLCGYCLTGVTTGQQLAFIHGEGGTGKSTFLNTVSQVMNDYHTTASMDAFTASSGTKHPTDIAALAGARLVTARETDAGRRWDEPLIKQLSGGDPVSARFMRQDSFTYRPQFKLVFVGNHAPHLRQVDRAIRRRLHIIPFDHVPAVVDGRLPERLAEEGPQILGWMVGGCLAWQQRGLSLPEVAAEKTDRYLRDEDSIGGWLEDSCELGAGYRETSKKLFQSWREWCNSQGSHPGDSKRLVAELEARGMRRHSDGKSRGFVGLRLKDPDGLGVVG